MNATPEWMKDMNQDVDDLEAQEEQDYAPPEPEQPPEAEPEEPEHSQQQQTVPLATLIEERKRLQEQLAEERARASRFERLESDKWLYVWAMSSVAFFVAAYRDTG